MVRKYACNPLTGYKIRVGGDTYKKLIEANIEPMQYVRGECEKSRKGRKKTSKEEVKQEEISEEEYQKLIASPGCSLDHPNRPCQSRGGKRSGLNRRYAKAEIHAIAKNCGIKITNPLTNRAKTMDQLCQEIGETLDIEITPYTKAPRAKREKEHGILGGKGRPKGIENRKREILECILDSSRPCHSHRGSRKTRYSKNHIHDIAKACGIRITDKITKRSKTMTQLCEEIAKKLNQNVWMP